jgi:hypothetical protein
LDIDHQFYPFYDRIFQVLGGDRILNWLIRVDATRNGKRSSVKGTNLLVNSTMALIRTEYLIAIQSLPLYWPEQPGCLFGATAQCNLYNQRNMCMELFNLYVFIENVFRPCGSNGQPLKFRMVFPLMRSSPFGIMDDLSKWLGNTSEAMYWRGVMRAMNWVPFLLVPVIVLNQHDVHNHGQGKWFLFVIDVDARGLLVFGEDCQPPTAELRIQVAKVVLGCKNLVLEVDERLSTSGIETLAFKYVQLNVPENSSFSSIYKLALCVEKFSNFLCFMREIIFADTEMLQRDMSLEYNNCTVMKELVSGLYMLERCVSVSKRERWGFARVWQTYSFSCESFVQPNRSTLDCKSYSR